MSLLCLKKIKICSWQRSSCIANMAKAVLCRTLCQRMAVIFMQQHGSSIRNTASFSPVLNGKAASQSCSPTGICCIRSLSTLRESGSGTTMLAWQINSYGRNDKLKLMERPIPTITKPDQVLIKVYASSVNPLDIKMRNGYGAVFLNKGRRVNPGDEFPLTLGRDCSGVIVDMGKGVKDFEVGQEVWATVNQIKQGAHAQYVLTTAGEMSLKPENLTHIEAASMPYVAITTWSATYAVARFRPENAVGQFALVHGGAGGVGSFAIQLLKAWNARVASTCSTDSVEFVRSLGANHVVDYKTTDPARELRKLGRFDYILDTVGGTVEEYSIKLLNGAKGATYITLVTPFIERIESKGAILGTVSASLELMKKAFDTAKQGGKYRWAFATPNAAALKTVAGLVQEGKIKPVVNKVFPFTEAPEALAAVEAGHPMGKTVISIATEDRKPRKTKVDIFKDT